VLLGAVARAYCAQVIKDVMLYNFNIYRAGMGAENDREAFYSVLVAVLAHKCLEAFALGLSIFYARFKRVVTVLMILGYSFATPLGVAAGISFLFSFFSFLFSFLFFSFLFFSFLFFSFLFCSVLFCSVLFCSVLFCSVLFCSVLFCSVLFCSVLFCSVLFSTFCARFKYVLAPVPLLPRFFYIYFVIFILS
jgi:hypothetical protein